MPEASGFFLLRAVITFTKPDVMEMLSPPPPVSDVELRVIQNDLTILGLSLMVNVMATKWNYGLRSTKIANNQITAHLAANAHKSDFTINTYFLRHL